VSIQQSKVEFAVDSMAVLVVSLKTCLACLISLCIISISSNSSLVLDLGSNLLVSNLGLYRSSNCTIQLG
jgi:hypothetical protein